MQPSTTEFREAAEEERMFGSLNAPVRYQMRIEPKLLLQDIGAPAFYTDYRFWVSTKGLYKNPAEQAIALAIDELVTYAQLGLHGFDYKYVKVVKWESLFVWPEDDDGNTARRLRGGETITADVELHLGVSGASGGRQLLSAGTRIPIAHQDHGDRQNPVRMSGHGGHKSSRSQSHITGGRDDQEIHPGMTITKSRVYHPQAFAGVRGVSRASSKDPKADAAPPSKDDAAPPSKDDAAPPSKDDAAPPSKDDAAPPSKGDDSKGGKEEEEAPVETSGPTTQPSVGPTSMPSMKPTLKPTFGPTLKPTAMPSLKPTEPPKEETDSKTPSKGDTPTPPSKGGSDEAAKGKDSPAPAPSKDEGKDSPAPAPSKDEGKAAPAPAPAPSKDEGKAGPAPAPSKDEGKAPPAPAPSKDDAKPAPAPKPEPASKPAPAPKGPSEPVETSWPTMKPTMKPTFNTDPTISPTPYPTGLRDTGPVEVKLRIAILLNDLGLVEQAATDGEESPEILAIYQSVVNDLDTAVVSGSLDKALQDNGLDTTVDVSQWVAPVNFTVLQFQPTLADYAREEFLRCYAQWVTGDPGVFLFPLKKPQTTGGGLTVQEVWAQDWEYLGSRGTTEGKGPFPGNNTVTKPLNQAWNRVYLGYQAMDDKCRKEYLGVVIGLTTFCVFFGTCFCFCCCCCCCCSCCRKKPKPKETYDKFCAMNFLEPKLKKTQGRRKNELPALNRVGKIISATEDRNKYKMSKEQLRAIEKAEEEKRKKEEEGILTRHKDPFGKYLVDKKAANDKSAKSLERQRKEREEQRTAANIKRREKAKQDKEDRLRTKEDEKRKKIEEREAAKKKKAEEKAKKEEEKEKKKEEDEKKKEADKKAKEEEVEKEKEKKIKKAKDEKDKKKKEEEKEKDPEYRKKKEEEEKAKEEEKRKKEEEAREKEAKKAEEKAKKEEEKKKAAEEKAAKKEADKKKKEEEKEAKAKAKEEEKKKKEEEKKKKEEEKKKKDEENQKKKEEKKKKGKDKKAAADDEEEEEWVPKPGDRVIVGGRKGVLVRKDEPEDEEEKEAEEKGEKPPSYVLAFDDVEEEGSEEVHLFPTMAKDLTPPPQKKTFGLF